MPVTVRKCPVRAREIVHARFRRRAIPAESHASWRRDEPFSFLAMQLKKRARARLQGGLERLAKAASLGPTSTLAGRPLVLHSPLTSSYIPDPAVAGAPSPPPVDKKHSQLHLGCILPGSEETISSTLLTRFYPAASHSRLHPGEINATPRLRMLPAMARQEQLAVYRRTSSGAVGDARRALARMEASSPADPRGSLLFSSSAISFVPPSDVTHLRAVNLGTPASTPRPNISDGEFARRIIPHIPDHLALPFYF